MRFAKCIKIVFKASFTFFIIFSLATLINDIDILIRKQFKQKTKILKLKIKENSDNYEWSQLKENYKTISFESKTTTTSKHLNRISYYCSQIPANLTGHITVQKPSDDFDPKSSISIRKNRNYQSIDGRWQPIDCKARHRVAVIIPFKDRANNLNYFLNHMHPFLQKQELEYQIFIVEQSNDQLFNKGVLMNSGFLEVMSLSRNRTWLDSIDFKLNEFPFDCVLFHDVDLLPQGLI